MNLYYRIKNESNQHEIASSEFPVKIKKELLADDKVWSRTTRTAKNQVHAEYLEGEDDMTVSFDVYYQCEGSCGEYFADITVTDSESGKLYYSSEAENEAADEEERWPKNKAKINGTHRRSGLCCWDLRR